MLICCYGVAMVLLSLPASLAVESVRDLGLDTTECSSSWRPSGSSRSLRVPLLSYREWFCDLEGGGRRRRREEGEGRRRREKGGGGERREEGGGGRREEGEGGGRSR